MNLSWDIEYLLDLCKKLDSPLNFFVQDGLKITHAQ